MLWGALFDHRTDLLLAFLPLAHILEQVCRAKSMADRSSLSSLSTYAGYL
jgi:long-subunit acyl-CoA synthetase (AMP-forming)